MRNKNKFSIQGIHKIHTKHPRFKDDLLNIETSTAYPQNSKDVFKSCLPSTLKVCISQKIELKGNLYENQFYWEILYLSLHRVNTIKFKVNFVVNLVTNYTTQKQNFGFEFKFIFCSLKGTWFKNFSLQYFQCKTLIINYNCIKFY